MSSLVFDINKLDNLKSLHAHEEDLRAESLRFLAADNSLSEMLFIIGNSMNLLFVYVHDHAARTNDELTLQYFGIRLFNAAATSMKLAFAGYAQMALAQIRDVLEVAFLLDYFRFNPAEIEVWQKATPKDQRTKFTPVVVRDALDKRDGNIEKKRAKAYALLSSYASHATYDGFKLTMKDGHGQIGPFFDEKKLRAWVQEMTLRVPPAAVIFAGLFKDVGDGLTEMQRVLQVQVLEWRAKD